MACSTRKKTQKAPQFSIARMQTCASCQHNVDGVCSLVKELKQGNLQKDALIEVGVLMPDAWCPIGKWGQHRGDPLGPGERRKCQWCGRLHDKPQEVCPWCQAKMGMQLRNMQKGIGGRAWGDPFDERLHDVRMRPFTGEVIKHLHFFLYPRFAENTDYHLSKLEELSDQFNGIKGVTVAIDGQTCEKQFNDRIRNLFDVVDVVQNDPRRRELVGFIPLLDKLLTDDPNHIICFAHGKGQQAHTHNTSIIRQWNDAMYETCVANAEQVIGAMEIGHPVTGVFKSIGAFRTTAFKWHYSGAFWWARSQAIRENPKWRQTCHRWWGAESYVGRHWWPQETHCLFGEHTGGGSLYDVHTWKRVDKELSEWRSQRTLASR